MAAANRAVDDNVATKVFTVVYIFEEAYFTGFVFVKLSRCYAFCDCGVSQVALAALLVIPRYARKFAADEENDKN